MGRRLGFVMVSCVAGVLFALGGTAVGEPAPSAPTEKEPDAKTPADAEDAIQLQADEMDLDLEEKSAELHGHVELTKPGMSLRCEHMSVRYDQVPIVKWAKGTGGVVLEVRGVKARAPEVVLDLEGNVVTMAGGVRVSRKEGWLSAEQATISLATGRVKLKQVKGVVAMPSKKAPSRSGSSKKKVDRSKRAAPKRP